MIKKSINFLNSKIKTRRAERNMPTMLYTFKLKGKIIKDTRVGSSTAFIGEQNLSLAENVFIGQFNFIEASNGISIEEGVQITNYISILSHSSHDAIRLYGKEYRKQSDLKGYQKGEVKIGKYSFIGPHTTIMPGTNVGKGSLISAYSFVSGTFPDFAIISGNPAKVVGSTKDRDVKLLETNPELKPLYDAWANE